MKLNKNKRLCEHHSRGEDILPNGRLVFNAIPNCYNPSADDTAGPSHVSPLVVTSTSYGSRTTIETNPTGRSSPATPPKVHFLLLHHQLKLDQLLPKDYVSTPTFSISCVITSSLHSYKIPKINFVHVINCIAFSLNLLATYSHLP